MAQSVSDIQPKSGLRKRKKDTATVSQQLHVCISAHQGLEVAVSIIVVKSVVATKWDHSHEVIQTGNGSQLRRTSAHPSVESRSRHFLLMIKYDKQNILLKSLACVRDIDGLTLYFDFQCFTSPLLIRDENQTSAGRNHQTSTWLRVL